MLSCHFVCVLKLLLLPLFSEYLEMQIGFKQYQQKVVGLAWNRYKFWKKAQFLTQRRPMNLLPPRIFQLGSLSLLSSLHLAIPTSQSAPRHLHIALNLAKHRRLQGPSLKKEVVLIKMLQSFASITFSSGPWYSSLVEITVNHNLTLSERAMTS